jgi:hypothetical protein
LTNTNSYAIINISNKERKTKMEKIKGIGLLGNITEEEMELAVATIKADREEKVRKAKIDELEKTLISAIKEIRELGGSVRLHGGGYVYASTSVNSTVSSSLEISYNYY